MKIVLHIGLEHCGGSALQDVMRAQRGALRKAGILYPRAPGRRNHTRLFMAATAPARTEPLRVARGLSDAGAQAQMRQKLTAELAAEVGQAKGTETVFLSCVQLAGGLTTPQEVATLHDILRPITENIHVVAHLDEQARLLTRHYAQAIWSGRTASLQQELDLAQTNQPWAQSALNARAGHSGDTPFAEYQAPPFWLDYEYIAELWQQQFGAAAVHLRPYDRQRFFGRDILAEIQDITGHQLQAGWFETPPVPAQPSAATLTRARALNGGLFALGRAGQTFSRRAWRQFYTDIAIDGPAIAPGSLSALSARFAAANKRLAAAHPALKPALKKERKQTDWQEAAPEQGFRLSQYLAAFVAQAGKPEPAEPAAPKAAALSPLAKSILPKAAQANFRKLQGGPFAPHNRMGHVNEEELAAEFAPLPPAKRPKGSSGKVIVACMKNEGPYILEWVAYHRAIGVDNFLIYTNDCSDGTDDILNRLQAMGVVQHRDNTKWKGNSPQQHALNLSLKEPLVKNAEWIIHIDVDEFINVRCGNGTLDDFLQRVPDATNIAMTWRLFGHNGVDTFRDDLVIDQFDTCAPKFCPKPHTVWGFKTMFRNIGAYQKISCHRPNKLNADMRDQVRWVNGSGTAMDDVLENGWRSSKKTVGYDLLQLNHYALRSADSFLVKRQRGRALHVDRSIGLNYWVRMDWGDYRDVTIKRNIPRLLAGLATLRQDSRLLKLHENAVAWHKAKAAELRASPEFATLLQQATATRLSEMERVAFALAQEVDS